MARGVKKGTYRGPYKRREREKKYVCSCSFGKDSLATLLLALENNEPLDAVVFVEVMFDNSRGISCEHPEHIRWVNEVAKPKLLEMGIDVIHLRGEKDYVGLFNSEIKSGPRAGMLRAFPIARMCCIQRECKLNPIRRFYKESFFKDGYDVHEYVGIAIDEVERLGSLENSDSVRITKSSLLAKYRYTETMALLKCHEYGLLSPIYFMGGGRNGCFFCPNQGIADFTRFRSNHFDLWYELKKLSKTPNMCSEMFKYDKTFADIEGEVKEYFDKNHQHIL